MVERGDLAADARGVSLLDVVNAERRRMAGDVTVPRGR